MDVNSAIEMIENHTFDEIKVGDGAHLTRTLKEEDIRQQRPRYCRSYEYP